MALEHLEAYFFTKSAIKTFTKISTREFTLLVGLRLMQQKSAGSSIQALQRYCEQQGHCWHYPNAVKIVNKLLTVGLISKRGRNLFVNEKGLLLLGSVERRLKKIVPAAAA